MEGDREEETAIAIDHDTETQQEFKVKSLKVSSTPKSFGLRLFHTEMWRVYLCGVTSHYLHLKS